MATRKPAGAKALAEMEDALRAEQALRRLHVAEHMRHSIRNIALQADVIDRAEKNRENASARTLKGAANIAAFAKRQGYPETCNRNALVIDAAEHFETSTRTIERWIVEAKKRNLLT